MNVNKLIEEFLKDHKGYLLGYFLFMLAYPISSVFLPKYYGGIVEDLKNNRQPKFKLIIILLVCVNLMYMTLEKMDTVFIPKLQAYIRVHIVRVVLENYKDKFQEQQLGSLISRIVKLPIVVRELVRQIRNYIVPLTLILLMVVIRFTLIDKRLGLIVFVCLSAGFAALIPFGRKCLEISANMDHETDAVHEDISELFDNMLDIYSMGTYEQEMESLEKRQDAIIATYKSTFECANNFRGLFNLLGMFTFISCIVYAYQLYRRKVIDLAGMINVAVTGMYVIGKFGSMSGELPDVVFNLGTYIRTERFISSLDLKPVKKESFDVKNGEIKFRGIGIRYGDKQVLKDFNLNIRPGESVAIIGKIGSGKSSLAKALLQLIPYDGYIYVDGKNVGDMDPTAIRSQVLFVRQNPIPFNRTLYENISYGNNSITRAHVEDLFARYDLHSFFDHDLEDPVGRKGDKLSGGQRQMIFLLRVLLNRNPIIILDEPTSSLDERSSKYVLRLLEDIMKTRTVLLITHDKNVGKLADRTVELA